MLHLDNNADSFHQIWVGLYLGIILHTHTHSHIHIYVVIILIILYFCFPVYAFFALMKVFPGDLDEDNEATQLFNNAFRLGAEKDIIAGVS